MEYYDYRVWIGWPENDIREYAREIAADQSLTLTQSEHLERQMAQRAGHWPERKDWIGPSKMDPDLESVYRSLGHGDEEIFKQNQRLNAPYIPPKFLLEERWETIGGGLTRKRARTITRESPAIKKRRQQDRRRKAKHPFTSMNLEMRNRSDDALWAANCYPIAYGDWLIPRGKEAPHEGLVWYSRELLNAYYNARDQARLGNSEAAMWHAFHAGALCAELDMRLAHGRTFDKYEAVSLAQRDAARSRKTVSDEVRREAYWRYRNQGDKRIEAGRSAASELGLSEASIRNAFPDGKYPPD